MVGHPPQFLLVDDTVEKRLEAPQDGALGDVFLGEDAESMDGTLSNGSPDKQHDSRLLAGVSIAVML
jgi:hypothetical protein